MKRLLLAPLAIVGNWFFRTTPDPSWEDWGTDADEEWWL